MNAEQFNQQFPVGSPVMYRDDFGEDHETATRSEAWDVCGTPVVSLRGRTGGHDIERVTARKA